ncbi:MAG: hypothetical protein KQH59_09235 [Desulfobulbaceae bacterium]|nr:hypothetical protein [Desulfobulbaceae bacterium]
MKKEPKTETEFARELRLLRLEMQRWRKEQETTKQMIKALIREYREDERDALLIAMKALVR